WIVVLLAARLFRRFAHERGRLVRICRDKTAHFLLDGGEFIWRESGVVDGLKLIDNPQHISDPMVAVGHGRIRLRHAPGPRNLNSLEIAHQRLRIQPARAMTWTAKKSASIS